jgi:phage gp36-like protein
MPQGKYTLDQLDQEQRPVDAGLPPFETLPQVPKAVTKTVTKKEATKPLESAPKAAAQTMPVQPTPQPTQGTKGKYKIDDIEYQSLGNNPLETITREAQRYGLEVGSTLRTPEENAAAGGADNSYHLYGRAADIKGDINKRREFTDYMGSTYGSNIAELLHEVEDHFDHVHVAWNEIKSTNPAIGGQVTQQNQFTTDDLINKLSGQNQPPREAIGVDLSDFVKANRPPTSQELSLLIANKMGFTPQEAQDYMAELGSNPFYGGAKDEQAAMASILDRARLNDRGEASIPGLDPNSFASIEKWLKENRYKKQLEGWRQLPHDQQIQVAQGLAKQGPLTDEQRHALGYTHGDLGELAINAGGNVTSMGGDLAAFSGFLGELLLGEGGNATWLKNKGLHLQEAGKEMQNIGGDQSVFGQAVGAGIGSLPYAATGILGKGATALLGGMQGGGSAYGEAKSSGKANEYESQIAGLLGVPVGAMQAFLGIGGRGGVVKRADAARIIKGILHEAGEEAGQEAIEQVLNNLIAKGIYDPSTGVMKNVGTSVILGAITGGAMGGAMGGLKRAAQGKGQAKGSKEVDPMLAKSHSVLLDPNEDAETKATLVEILKKKGQPLPEGYVDPSAPVAAAPAAPADVTVEGGATIVPEDAPIGKRIDGRKLGEVPRDEKAEAVIGGVKVNGKRTKGFETAKPLEPREDALPVPPPKGVSVEVVETNGKKTVTRKTKEEKEGTKVGAALGKDAAAPEVAKEKAKEVKAKEAKATKAPRAKAVSKKNGAAAAVTTQGQPTATAAPSIDKKSMLQQALDKAKAKGTVNVIPATEAKAETKVEPKVETKLAEGEYEEATVSGLKGATFHIIGEEGADYKLKDKATGKEFNLSKSSVTKSGVKSKPVQAVASKVEPEAKVVTPKAPVVAKKELTEEDQLNTEIKGLQSVLKGNENKKTKAVLEQKKQLAAKQAQLDKLQGKADPKVKELEDSITGLEAIVKGAEEGTPGHAIAKTALEEKKKELEKLKTPKVEVKAVTPKGKIGTLDTQDKRLDNLVAIAQSSGTGAIEKAKKQGATNAEVAFLESYLKDTKDGKDAFSNPKALENAKAAFSKTMEENQSKKVTPKVEESKTPVKEKTLAEKLAEYEANKKVTPKYEPKRETNKTPEEVEAIGKDRTKRLEAAMAAVKEMQTIVSESKGDGKAVASQILEEKKKEMKAIQEEYAFPELTKEEFEAEKAKYHEKKAEEKKAKAVTPAPKVVSKKRSAIEQLKESRDQFKEDTAKATTPEQKREAQEMYNKVLRNEPTKENGSKYIDPDLTARQKEFSKEISKLKGILYKTEEGTPEYKTAKKAVDDKIEELDEYLEKYKAPKPQEPPVVSKEAQDLIDSIEKQKPAILNETSEKASEIIAKGTEAAAKGEAKVEVKEVTRKEKPSLVKKLDPETAPKSADGVLIVEQVKDGRFRVRNTKTEEATVVYKTLDEALKRLSVEEKGEEGSSLEYAPDSKVKSPLGVTLTAPSNAAPQFVKDAFARQKKQEGKKKLGSGGPDTQDIIDHVLIAGHKYYTKGKKFIDWADRVIADLGAKGKEGYEFLQTTWELLQDIGGSIGPIGKFNLIEDSAMRAEWKTVGDMVRAGKTEDDIFAATGWYRGKYDKRWRYGLSDANMKLLPTFDTLEESKLFSNPTSMKLGDILHHPILFKAYPDLAHVDVIRKPGFFDFGGLQGYYDSVNNVINITPNAKDTLSTLRHEIQHWIQDKEKWASGGNTDIALNQASPEQKNKLLKEVINQKEADLIAKEQAYNYTKNIVKGMEKIENTPEIREAAQDLFNIKQIWGSVWSLDSEGAEEIKRNTMKKVEEAENKLSKLLGFNTMDERLETDNWRVFYNVAEAGGIDEALTKFKERAFRELGYLTDARKGHEDLVAGKKEAIDKALDSVSYNLYKNIAGEIEARDVQARMKMTPEERKAAKPLESEGISEEDSIVFRIDNSTPTPKSSLENAPEIVKKAAQRLAVRSEAMAEGSLKEMGSGGPNSKVVLDHLLVKGWELYQTVKDKAAWLSEMKAKWGNDIEPQLDKIYNRLIGVANVEGEKEDALPEGFKERLTPQTLEEKGLPGGTDRIYKVAPNKETLTKAQEIIADKGVDGAIEWLNSSNAVSPEHTATAMVLIDQLSESNPAKASEIATSLSEKLTKVGQAIQAVNVLNLLSPAKQMVAVAKMYKNEHGTTMPGDKATEFAQAAREEADATAEAQKLEGQLAKTKNPIAQSIIADAITEAHAKAKSAKKKKAKVVGSISPWKNLTRKISRANIFRAIQASWDLSAAGRQGAIFTVMHPQISARAFGYQWKALWKDPKAYREMTRSILEEDPEYKNARKDGVEFTLASSAGKSELSEMEEAYMNDIFQEWAESDSNVKRALAAPIVRSEQAYVTYLNQQRLGVYKTYAAALNKAGITREDNHNEYKYAANFINIATGRGNFGKGKLNDAVPFLNSLLFSPKYVLSRFQVLSEAAKLALPNKGSVMIKGKEIPLPKGASSAVMRKMVAKDLLGFGAAVGVTLGLLRHWLDDDEEKKVTDPDSADFLKVKIGDAHYDISGGMQSELKLIYKMVDYFGKQEDLIKAGPYLKDPETGKPTRTAGGELMEFTRKKLAPIPSYAAGYFTNESMEYDELGKKKPFLRNPNLPIVGEVEKFEDTKLEKPSKLFNETAKMFAPITIRDFYDAFSKQGVKGVLKASPGVLGISTQIYEDRR